MNAFVGVVTESVGLVPSEVFQHQNFRPTIKVILKNGCHICMVNCTAGYHRACAVGSLMFGVLRAPCLHLNFLQNKVSLASKRNHP